MTVTGTYRHCLVTLSNICSIIQPYLFTSFQWDRVRLFSSSNLWQTICFGPCPGSLHGTAFSWAAGAAIARVGGSVGGTLPLRSVPARVPGVTRYTKQQFCRQLAHGPTPCTAGVSGASVCRCPVGACPPLDAVCAVWPWLVCHSGILHTRPIQRTEAGPMVWTIFHVWATFTLRIQFCPKNLRRARTQSLEVSKAQLCCPACCLGWCFAKLTARAW